MKKEDIGYLTEGASKYTRQVDGAQSKLGLIKILKSWSWLLPDAFDAVNKKEFKWTEWKDWSRNKKYITEPTEKQKDIYAVISVPANMLKISMVAHHFKAPWGAAFKRLEEFGEFK